MHVMNSNSYGKPHPSKKDRRDEAREKAKSMRIEEQKRKKRNSILVRSGIGVGVLAAAAIVALVIVNSTAPASAGPLNMASDGILLTGDGTSVTAVETTAVPADATPDPTDHSALTDTANIAMYVDYLCPYCGQFEAANAEQITNWVTAGNATLEVHPISILDGNSAGSKYSTRAANAAACVANYDPNNFLPVHTALFANQPAEGTTGLTNAQLVSLVEGAGVTDADVTSCINNQEFSSWVGTATDRALSGPLGNADIEKVSGTPTVLVNGVSYTGSLSDATAFASFVAEQVGATAGTQ